MDGSKSDRPISPNVSNNVSRGQLFCRSQPAVRPNAAKCLISVKIYFPSRLRACFFLGGGGGGGAPSPSGTEGEDATPPAR